MTTQDALDKLDRALCRLAPDQGRIARRNARVKVAHALKTLRDVIDDEYPTIRKPPRPSRRRLLTPAERETRARRRLVEQGYVAAGDFNTLARLAEVGIRVRRVGGTTFIPEWAIVLARYLPEKLAEARRSLRLRKAALATVVLRQEAQRQAGGIR